MIDAATASNSKLKKEKMKEKPKLKVSAKEKTASSSTPSVSGNFFGSFSASTFKASFENATQKLTREIGDLADKVATEAKRTFYSPDTVEVTAIKVLESIDRMTISKKDRSVVSLYFVDGDKLVFRFEDVATLTQELRAALKKEKN